MGEEASRSLNEANFIRNASVLEYAWYAQKLIYVIKLFLSVCSVDCIYRIYDSFITGSIKNPKDVRLQYSVSVLIYLKYILLIVRFH